MLSKDTHRFILYIRDRIEQGKPVFRGRTESGTVHAGTKDQIGTGVYTIMYKKCSLRGIMKKKILLCLIAQLICWGIMTMFQFDCCICGSHDVCGSVYYIQEIDI